MRDFINLFEEGSNESAMPPALTVKDFLLARIAFDYRENSPASTFPTLVRKYPDLVFKTLGVTKEQFNEAVHHPKPWFSNENFTPFFAFIHYLYRNKLSKEWEEKNIRPLSAGFKRAFQTIQKKYYDTKAYKVLIKNDQKFFVDRLHSGYKDLKASGSTGKHFDNVVSEIASLFAFAIKIKLIKSGDISAEALEHLLHPNYA